eukprot:gene20928-25647_t
MAKSSRAMRALGHPCGLHVRAFDPDTVSEANVGRQLYSRADVDGGYGTGATSGPAPAFIPFTAETADGLPDHKQISQEFRVESSTKDRLQWIGGVYYFKEDIVVDSFNFDTLGGGVVNGFA